MTPQRFYRRPEVETLIGLKHTRLYEMVRAGEFPKPVRISPGAVAWTEGDIARWQQARIAERDTPPPKQSKRRRLA